jgi:hypothetical protein
LNPYLGIRVIDQGVEQLVRPVTAMHQGSDLMEILVDEPAQQRAWDRRILGQPSQPGSGGIVVPGEERVVDVQRNLRGAFTRTAQRRELYGHAPC